MSPTRIDTTATTHESVINNCSSEGEEEIEEPNEVLSKNTRTRAYICLQKRTAYFFVQSTMNDPIC